VNGAFQVEGLHRHYAEPHRASFVLRCSRTDPDQGVLAIHDTLDRLAAVEPTGANLVRLRSFGGRTLREAAADLGIAPRTADSWWAYARAWLAADLQHG
jgi:hypothetical protein